MKRNSRISMESALISCSIPDYDDENMDEEEHKEFLKNNQQLKCGDILLTNSHSIRLCCSYCKKQFKSVEVFLRHILKNHLTLARPEECESLHPAEKLCLQKDIKIEAECENPLLLPEPNIAVANVTSTSRISQDNSDNFICQFEQYLLQPENKCNLSAEDYEEYELQEESFQDMSHNNQEAEIDEIKYEIEVLNEDTIGPKESNDCFKKPKKRGMAKLDQFQCTFCTKVFKTKRALKRHTMYHTTNKPYACEHCDGRFQDKSNLLVHTKRHLGIKSHACSLCDKLFISSTELKMHLRSHTGEKPYVCEVCGRNFTTSSKMMSHRRRHYNERPFECEICGKHFYERKLLREHEATHSTERPFVCDVCNTTFKRITDLKEHKKLHSGVKSYVCKLCSKSFAQNAGLWSHTKQHHSYKPT